MSASNVSDMNDIGFMEDRAALFISSQHIYNWLEHEVLDVLKLYASVEKTAAAQLPINNMKTIQTTGLCLMILTIV